MTRSTLTDKDIERIQSLGGADLGATYQALTDRLRATRPAIMANRHVVATRLSVDVCEKINRIALTHRMTRSEVVREAVERFVATQPHLGNVAVLAERLLRYQR